jgi:Flp pilus assembly protein TadG
MTAQPNWNRHRRRGIVAVELALILPVLLVLLAGTLEIGRVIEVEQILSNAVREGARQAITAKAAPSSVQQTVSDYVRNATLPVERLMITVENVTSPSLSLLSANKGDRIRVTASLRYEDVQWVNIHIFVQPTTLIRGETSWSSMGAN